MRSSGVVFGARISGQHLGFQEGLKLFDGQKLVAEAFVDRLAVAVLPRWSWFVNVARQNSSCARRYEHGSGRWPHGDVLAFL
jgi:hypothetical protein